MFLTNLFGPRFSKIKPGTNFKVPKHPNPMYSQYTFTVQDVQPDAFSKRFRVVALRIREFMAQMLENLGLDKQKPDENVLQQIVNTVPAAVFKLKKTFFGGVRLLDPGTGKEYKIRIVE
jgi:hypothetical protein